ncbi:hypothetical protein ACIHAA_05625 [Streptomyces sp. NPDC052040]|uniref:hypothetical protein n=1 Tax=unclassified Streptomyces TaxID=2593676 RepID=UPI0037D68F78
MSIRNLGDWSPLDLDSDPVRADPDVVRDAQKRYQHIAATIDDATAKLQKIVGTSSDSLAGQYVEGLKSSANSLNDRLTKAGVRYHDVADEIAKYEPDLDRGLSETAGALTDAEAAHDAQTKAKGMPDPQKKPDGTTDPDEQAKGDAKNKATSDADAKMAAAKTRLDNALNALNTAGKRFGDAVNAKNYKDGLTDSFKDKLDAVMAKISQIFAIIGMVLAALAILIPGVNVLVIAGVVAGAITLVANIVLYVDGKGSLADVILGAVGLGLAGLGAIASVVGKGISSAAKAAASAGARPRPIPVGGGNGGIPMVPLRPVGAGGRPTPNFSRPFGPGNPRPVPNFSRPFGPGNQPGAAASGAGRPVPNFSRPFAPPPANAATSWQNLSEWFNNPATNWLLGKSGAVTPDIGFWASTWSQLKGAGSMWATLLTNPAQFGKDFASIVAGIKGAQDLGAVVAAANLGKISPLWFAWGGLNGAFGLGAGFIYTGGRLKGWIPAANPPGYATA